MSITVINKNNIDYFKHYLEGIEDRILNKELVVIGLVEDNLSVGVLAAQIIKNEAYIKIINVLNNKKEYIDGLLNGFIGECINFNKITVIYGEIEENKYSDTVFKCYIDKGFICNMPEIFSTYSINREIYTGLPLWTNSKVKRYTISSLKEIPIYYINKFAEKYDEEKSVLYSYIKKQQYNSKDICITENNDIIGYFIFDFEYENNEKNMYVKKIWTDKTNKIALPNLLYGLKKQVEKEQNINDINFITNDIYSTRISKVLEGESSKKLLYWLYKAL